MPKILTIALLAAALGTLSPADASAQRPPPRGGGPSPAVVGTGNYGMAGCGLGSMVIGSQPGFMQVFAATTNGTFGTQTFGITFGTSNCVDQPGGAIGAVSFVETNRAVVAKDIARGAGETIATLATIGGCKDARAVGARLQRQYGAIFPSASVSDRQVGQAVVDAMRGDAALSCTKL